MGYSREGLLNFFNVNNILFKEYAAFGEKPYVFSVNIPDITSG